MQVLVIIKELKQETD